MNISNKNVIWLDQLGMKDVDRVGGKNASLGEMIQHLTSVGIRVPMGFATTARAYREFMQQNGLQDKINLFLKNLDVKNILMLQSRFDHQQLLKIYQKLLLLVSKKLI